MNTEDILASYYDAWLRTDRAAARAHLCDDLVFRSPKDAFASADEFLGACWQYAEDFTEMTLLHGVYADESAYIVYRSADFCVGELHKFRDGKIAEVYVTFDPTT